MEFPTAIDAGTVPRQNIQNARKVLIALGGEDRVAHLKKASCAAAGMCTWAANICAYYPSPRRLSHQTLQLLRLAQSGKANRKLGRTSSSAKQTSQN